MKNDNLVVIEKEEEVSLITLNDESSFNALSEDLLNKLFLVFEILFWFSSKEENSLQK